MPARCQPQLHGEAWPETGTQEGMLMQGEGRHPWGQQEHYPCWMGRTHSQRVYVLPLVSQAAVVMCVARVVVVASGIVRLLGPMAAVPGMPAGPLAVPAMLAMHTVHAVPLVHVLRAEQFVHTV